MVAVPLRTLTVFLSISHSSILSSILAGIETVRQKKNERTTSSQQTFAVFFSSFLPFPNTNTLDLSGNWTPTHINDESAINYCEMSQWNQKAVKLSHLDIHLRIITIYVLKKLLVYMLEITRLTSMSLTKYRSIIFDRQE